MDAAVYFILSSATERENRQRQYTIARDSAELMKLGFRFEVFSFLENFLTEPELTVNIIICEVSLLNY